MPRLQAVVADERLREPILYPQAWDLREIVQIGAEDKCVMDKGN